MADDQSDKSEEPTAKRIEEFRKEGKIAQSRDIGGVAILAASLLLLYWNGPVFVEIALEMFRQSLKGLTTVDHSGAKGPLWVVIHHALKAAALLIAPIAATSLLIACVAGLGQTGANVSWKALEFKAEKFNIFKSIKQILFSVSTLQQIGLSIAKAGFLGVSLYVVIRLHLPTLASSAQVDLSSALHNIGLAILAITIAAILGNTILAALDYWFSYQKLQKEMKMSKQEVKDERKQSEGDPQIKQQIRIRMMQLGQNRMLADVASSDVVVVNPTHYAVALSYNPQVDQAPRLVAKGKDKLAAKIRERARKHQVPIISNPPVARAIFAGGAVGEAIPAELYEMVAKVLAYLYRITGKSAA